MPQITGTWDSQLLVWGEANAAFTQKYPIFSVGAAFYKGEIGSVFVGGNGVPVVLERTGLTVTGRNMHGELKSDPAVRKKVTGVWPLISGRAGDIISVSCGWHDAPGSPVTWQGPRAFIVGQTTFLDFDLVEGPYLAIKFESSGQFSWRLLAYDLDLEIVGEH